MKSKSKIMYIPFRFPRFFLNVEALSHQLCCTASFSADHSAPDPGKKKQPQSANPSAETECSRKIKRNDNTAADEYRAQENEHAHAITKSKWKIVRSQQNQ